MPALFTYIRVLCGGLAASLVLAGGAAVAQQNIFHYSWSSAPPAD